MPLCLAKARQLRRALAHLGHRPGRRLHRVRPHGLDRVDHRDSGAQAHQRGQNLFQVDLGQQLHATDIQLQPPRAQGDLLARFLAGDIKHVLAGLRQTRQRLQQQGRLADARIAADQHDATGHQPATEHAIEFFHPGGLPRLFARTYLGQHLQAPGAAQRGEVATRRLRRFDHGLDQGVPLPAARTLTLPLGQTGAALGAGILRPGLRHQSISITGTRAARAQNNS